MTRVFVVVVATSTLVAAACGFDGAGSGGAASEAGLPDGAAVTSEDGSSTVQIDPDATVKPGCAWPTLQAGSPWPMLGGCVTHAGRSAFRGPHKAPHELWQKSFASYHPTLVIGADGTIYAAGDRDGIRIFAPDGGTRNVSFSGDDLTNTPAIASDGTLWAGAGNNVVSLRPDGGRTSHDMSENVDTSAVIDANGNVYMASYANKLVSLDATGKYRWDFVTGDDIKSSAAIGANGDIYFGSHDNFMYAVTKSGMLHWKYDVGADIDSSPVVADDGTIYIGVTNNHLHAFAPDGTHKWDYTGPGSFDWQVLPALAHDGTIYAPSGSKLVALRPDKSERWTFDATDAITAAVVVDADGIVYVANDAQLLFAIDPDTGKELWRYDVGDIARGFAIAKDGTMYVACGDNTKMYAIHELARVGAGVGANAQKEHGQAWRPMERGNGVVSGAASATSSRSSRCRRARSRIRRRCRLQGRRLRGT